MTTEDLNRETRLRRLANQQGLVLRKSRARDIRHPAYGTYGLVDAADESLVAGDTNTGYGLFLEDVETALRDGAPIHVDRTTNDIGLTFEDTNGEPIARFMGTTWYLYLPWDDDPRTLGGPADMTENEVQWMARQNLGWSQ